MSLPQLTVFTPTYNRAHTLIRCYESLKRQTNKEFVWLIVDDGSSDETENMVMGWMQEEKGFKINYLYQENSGMHSAHNLAYENIFTELNVCIDSDDYMPIDAVEKILLFWNEQKDKENIAGFMALDALENGQIIGNEFPENIKKATSYDYYFKYGLKGDKKFILRTELCKLNRYPVF
ncbi:MAG TPA: glycosyltransferase family A protein, partial [Oscillospiraceae bacterium]|nr:glycosyltransferase family A protein [Oscillospiraceae bacterium]